MVPIVLIYGLCVCLAGAGLPTEALPGGFRCLTHDRLHHAARGRDALALQMRPHLQAGLPALRLAFAGLVGRADSGEDLGHYRGAPPTRFLAPATAAHGLGEIAHGNASGHARRSTLPHPMGRIGDGWASGVVAATVVRRAGADL